MRPVAEVAAAVTAFAHAHLDGEVNCEDSRLLPEFVTSLPWLSPTLARQFARHDDPQVRIQVADNPVTPPPVLGRLLHDAAGPVRDAALRNPSTPYPAVAKVAAATGTIADTTALLTHPDCPARTLTEALRYPSRIDAALRHRNLPADLVHGLAGTGYGQKYSTDLLESPHLTHAEAEAIIETSGDPAYLASTWAKHPNADPTWLAALADLHFTDPDHGTLVSIATNVNTPAATLTRIVTSHACSANALANPSCPADAFHTALDTASGHPTPSATSPRPIAVSNWRMLATIATNPSAPVDVLDRIPAAVLSTHDDRYRFTLAHADTAEQAQTLLALAPTWSGTAGDLLTSAQSITAPASSPDLA